MELLFYADETDIKLSKVLIQFSWPIPGLTLRVLEFSIAKIIAIARKFGGRKRNFTGEVFWARGYFVSTVGLDEEVVRAYIWHQQTEDERYDRMKLSM